MGEISGIRIVRDKRTGKWFVFVDMRYRFKRKRGIGAEGETWDKIVEQFPKYMQSYIRGLKDIIKNYWKPVINTRHEKVWYKEFPATQLTR